jgi:hypothetical protein
MWQHYKYSFILHALGSAFALYYAGIQGLIIMSVLIILEASLSFDNAVVNAKTLEHFDDTWRHRFLTWGMLIAVFGARFVMPIGIVSVATGSGLLDVATMALTDPDQYSSKLDSVHHEIAAFGGAFLFMVASKFFIDETKEHHWLGKIEEKLSSLGRIEAIQAALALVAILISGSLITDPVRAHQFVIAGIIGVLTYVAVDMIGVLLESEDATNSVARTGLAGFIYLEVLDLSFSLDGVIAAFAISKDVIVIMTGLAVGAMYVRSMTIHLVEAKTLSHYKFLEHGAMTAIFALSMIMFSSVHVHIPEVVTGLIGAVLIGLSLYSSIRSKKEA